MITIRLNGTVQEFQTPLTIEELLQRLQVRLQAVAIARNEEIVPRSELAETVLKDGDRIEVVRAVGGG